MFDNSIFSKNSKKNHEFINLNYYYNIFECLNFQKF